MNFLFDLSLSSYNFFIKFLTKIINLGINTGLILCYSENIHKDQGILFKFQAYPNVLPKTNIYFVIWFSLMQESKFLNYDTTQIFINTSFL